ncbi:MAG: M56 family metallopeptidase [Lachnospiraceae bacterium]|nr:M56 family metallopeptidase [Lachnospiraceae bacterium]
MDLSIVSVINILCFSSVAILLLYCIANNLGTPLGKSIKRPFVLAILLILMIRLFLPLEFPCQQNLYITKAYPDLYVSFIYATISYAGKEYSLPLITAAVSVIGSIICLGRLLLFFLATIQSINRCAPAENPVITELVNTITYELGCKKCFRIVKNPNRTTPYLFGFRKPVIVLPDIQLSETEWYYILKHEIYHYYNKDLWLRFVCELLQIIYWWNPFIYILRNQIIKFQEFYADMAVVQCSSKLQQLEYMQCLIKIVKQLPVKTDNRVAAFHSNAKIQKRIAALLNFSETAPPNQRQRSAGSALAVILMICTLFLPNLFILEPCGEIPEEVLGDAVIINKANGHLVLREDGRYDIYVDNEYFSTVTTIFDDTLPIMNTKGEIIQ